ncbi:MAG: FumA C-terminus/TtdB family hydratase beta subunit [Spirochaetales bacterium]|nr:FumA C-terminus/TtdB family hydratase beta subunit [Spirochaetales bacterium]
MNNNANPGDFPKQKQEFEKLEELEELEELKGRHISLPADKETISSLQAGDAVLLSGSILVGRDQVHKRLAAALRNGEELPVDITNQLMYYMGPAPAPPNMIIGSCGPTTASRMDPFAEILLKHGLLGMIGKGPRSRSVAEAAAEYRGIYFYAFGGCGALYASCVRAITMAAYEDLGPEALYRLEVKNFPVVTAIDPSGKDIYASSEKTMK